MAASLDTFITMACEMRKAGQHHETSSRHRCMDTWSQDAVGVYRELWASLKSRQVRGHGAVVTK
jgi:hypothetical protein